jgi:hypothetical protein
MRDQASGLEAAVSVFKLQPAGALTLDLAAPAAAAAGIAPLTPAAAGRPGRVGPLRCGGSGMAHNGCFASALCGPQ